MAVSRRRAVFLDKDGTLLRDLPYNVDPAKMELMPGVPEGLRALRDAGYRLVMVSNQSGAARGYFPLRALGVVEARLRELLKAEGVALAAVYWCPHHPEGVVRCLDVFCVCRKPFPGLLRQAASDLGIDLARSWMAGDILNDIEAGRRAGCYTALVETGGETEWHGGPLRIPDVVATRFDEAATAILEHDRLRRAVRMEMRT